MLYCSYWLTNTISLYSANRNCPHDEMYTEYSCDLATVETDVRNERCRIQTNILLGLHFTHNLDNTLNRLWLMNILIDFPNTHTHTHAVVLDPQQWDSMLKRLNSSLLPLWVYTEESQAHPIKQSVFVRLLTTEGCFSHYQILYIPSDGKHIPVPHTQTHTHSRWNTAVFVCVGAQHINPVSQR